MNIIQLSNAFINFDNVTLVEGRENGVLVFFNCENNDRAHSRFFEDKDAETIMAYLRSYVEE